MVVLVVVVVVVDDGGKQELGEEEGEEGRGGRCLYPYGHSLKSLKIRLVGGT